MFVIFGIFTLILDLFADCLYYWINNFRSNLKKFVVDIIKSTITLES